MRGGLPAALAATALFVIAAPVGETMLRVAACLPAALNLPAAMLLTTLVAAIVMSRLLVLVAVAIPVICLLYTSDAAAE